MVVIGKLILTHRQQYVVHVLITWCIIKLKNLNLKQIFTKNKMLFINAVLLRYCVMACDKNAYCMIL